MEILRRKLINTEEFQVGDQIGITLTGFGDFTATAQKNTEEGTVFMFDEYIARRSMNETDTNAGGFKASKLYWWLQHDLLPSFPEHLKNRICDLTIPTVGQIFGHNDEWCNNNIVMDKGEQFLLMKERKNRVAYYKNEYGWGWLQNQHKNYSTYFAFVHSYGRADYDLASNALGVRPVFTLVKKDHEDLVPHNKEELLTVAQNLKELMDSLIQAGFTKEQAFRMILETIGGAARCVK